LDAFFLGGSRLSSLPPGETAGWKACYHQPPT
jgi:hypothetical protein